MSTRRERRTWKNWRGVLHEVIYEADTPLGKAFDIALVIAIIASVIAVCLDSVPLFQKEYYKPLRVVEWFFTILFTIEYGLRIVSIKKPVRYIFSFYGIVDLIAILPTYLGLFFYGMHTFMVVRTLRLLRIFRVLKLVHFLGEAEALSDALLASRRKITVFLFVVLTIVTIFGAILYMVEGPDAGFESIPVAMYWAIVTVTTVGYGDIVPQTLFGKFLSASLMIIGYSIIAVPTGIVTAEMTRRYKKDTNTQSCPTCAASTHDPDAKFCKICGAKL